jgi:hypothetical protein
MSVVYLVTYICTYIQLYVVINACAVDARWTTFV